MAITREQLLADPSSGARPLFRDEPAERAAQCLLATSRIGRRLQVRVGHPEVLDDMRRAAWRIHPPRCQAEPEAI